MQDRALRVAELLHERAGVGTPVSVLEPFGGFTVTAAGCFNDAHIVAAHPRQRSRRRRPLQLGCSVYEAFDGWPA